LYQLFRPEFLQKLGYSLSSDAFSPFGGPENRQHNKENILATSELFSHVYHFAQWLEENYTTVRLESQLTEMIHRFAILFYLLSSFRC
jgi:hypothetical protein